MSETLADRIRHRQEVTVAASGDWRIEYENGRFAVWFYGNFYGRFEGVEDMLGVIPEYRRDSIRRQVADSMQMTLGV